MSIISFVPGHTNLGLVQFPGLKRHVRPLAASHSPHLYPHLYPLTILLAIIIILR